MQKTHKSFAVGAVGFIGLLVLSFAWLFGAQSNAFAQGGGTTTYENVTVTTVEDVTVTGTWGSVTVTAEGESATGVTKGTGSDGDGSSGRSTTATPLTDEHVTIVAGLNNVTWSMDNPADAVAYRVKRSMSIQGEQSPYQTLTNSQTGLRYPDWDVMYGATYRYQVTPIAADKNELTPIEATYTTGSSRMLYGRFNGTQVEIKVRAYALYPYRTQYMTIKEYNHVERNPAQAVIVVDKQRLAGAVNSVTFTPTWGDGEVRYYTLELFQKRGTGSNASYKRVPITVDPLGIRKGAAEPASAPTQPSVTVHADGRAALAWEVNNANRSVFAYEVKRRPLKPINQLPFAHVGTTVGTSFNIPPATPIIEPPYEYKVTPIKGDATRSQMVSNAQSHPDLTTPVCLNPLTAPLYVPVGLIYLLPDITQPIGAGTPRTFDAIVADTGAYPCGGVDPRDFFAERHFYYVHQQDDAKCPVAGTSCTLVNSKPSGTGGWYEDLYNSEISVWGVAKFQALTFTDNDLKPGRYGIRYRVCTTNEAKCSRWWDTGVNNVGVESIPFVGPQEPITPAMRTLGGGLVSFGTWRQPYIL